jgi:penicillin-binding protein 1A
VRTALAKSDNDAASKLLEEVGAPNVVAWARALGVESHLAPTPSLALGAYEVTPRELVNAIGTLASGGEFEPARLIVRVVGPGGAELPLPALPSRRRVMSPEEAYLTTSLLESVVESGTGRAASALKRPLAGKTGTTNQAKDAWFVGYSTEVVAGVWVGYDEPIGLGWGESGSATALPIWMSFMKAAHEGRPSTDFPRPPGIAVATIDPHTGLLAYPGQTDAVEEEFLDGTVPSSVAVPDTPEVDAGAPLDGGTAVEDGVDDGVVEEASGADHGSAPPPKEEPLPSDAGISPPPPF